MMPQLINIPVKIFTILCFMLGGLPFMTYYDYGLRFKYLRKQRNISLKTAAQVINTSRQRLGKWQGEFRL